MRARSALPVVLLVLAPTFLPAQYREARSADYLLAATAQDARALWVNPAGLGVVQEASIMAELAFERPGDALELSQYTVGFNSAGVAFAFRRDRFPGIAPSNNTFRLGAGRGVGRLAAGGSLTFYPGSRDLDFGMRYVLTRAIEFGAVVTHLLTPTVRDSTLPLTGQLGVALRPMRGVVFTAQGQAASLDAPEGWTATYATGLSLHHFPRRGGLGFGVIATAHLNDRLNVTRASLGISVGGQDRVVIVGSGPVQDGVELRGASVVGLMSREPLGRR